MFGWFKKQPKPAPMAENVAPKQQHEIDAAELAQLLLNEYVCKIVVDAAKDRPLDAATTGRYEAKTRRYQLAAVLMALKGEERQHPSFGPVREHIESTVFASSPDGEASLRAEINQAEQSLNDDLLLPRGLGKETGIRWAHAWLDDIGVDEWKWNPATCALIALNWTDYYIMVLDTLRAFKPVASSKQ